MDHQPERRSFSGERLRKIREREGMTQMELAAKIGACSNNMISWWETGKFKPGADYLYALCVALKCDLEELYE